MLDPDANLNDYIPFLVGGGEMGERIRCHNWSLTPLGPLDTWPGALKAALRIVLQTPVPMVLLWGSSGVMIYNDGYAKFAADRHPGLLGKDVRIAWPEIAAFNDHVMNVCLSGKTLSYVDQELLIFRNGCDQQVWINLDYSPVLDKKGQSVGVLAIVVETTARVVADRFDAIEQDRLQRMFEQAPSFMAMLRGSNHVFEMVNPGYLQLIGNRPVLGKSVAEALPEVATQGFIDMLDSAFTSGAAMTGTAMAVLLHRDEAKGPEKRFVDLVYQPIRNHENVVTHIFVQGSDVTDRVLGEQHQRLLMNELSHRVKNTLATVAAIATRTLRGATSLKTANVSLRARIMALSGAQDILTRRTNTWADIGEVVTVAVQPHNDNTGQFQIDGPQLALNPDAALALSLALHELSTNATKYGALSVQSGKVLISWVLDQTGYEPTLHLTWEESGGPVVSSPTSEGFGSTLIKDGLAAGTSGTTSVEYRPAGVVFQLTAPVKAIKERLSA